jgi:hypothetical protein
VLGNTEWKSLFDLEFSPVHGGRGRDEELPCGAARSRRRQALGTRSIQEPARGARSANASSASRDQVLAWSRPIRPGGVLVEDARHKAPAQVEEEDKEVNRGGEPAEEGGESVRWSGSPPAPPRDGRRRTGRGEGRR